MMPNLLPARRDAYLRALNELVGYLSIHTYQPVDGEMFCLMYNIRPAFFDALRDLDAVELDLAKMAVRGETWYKRTALLLDYTPEDVVAAMQRNQVDCSADVLDIAVSIGCEVAPPKGEWVRFFDSRTNEFMTDDLSDTQVADEEKPDPRLQPCSYDEMIASLATVEAEFNKADEASDEAGKLREYARLCQRVALDALRLADSTEQMVAAGLSLNFPLPSVND